MDKYHAELAALMAVDKSPRDEALTRYQRIWKWRAIVPSASVLLAWTCLTFTAPGKGSPAEGVLDMLVFLGFPRWGWPGSAVEAAVVALHCLSVLSPMLAWDRVRGAMRRTSAPTELARGSYRAGPPAPRSWHVSGPFPWWTAAMLVVVLLSHASFIILHLAGVFATWGLGLRSDYPLVDTLLENSIAGLAQGCLLWFWWVKCRRDAARVGVIEEATKPDGSPGLVLHTPGGVRPVTIAEYDPSSRRLRLFDSPDIWHAVDPIHDLVSVDDTHTRRCDGLGERAPW
jgi:hypothetical protein